MELAYADIELINADDEALASRHIIVEDEIRRLKSVMLVDSGAYMMAINERIQSQLELPLVEMGKVQVADGRVAEYPLLAPLRFFKTSKPRRRVSRARANTKCAWKSDNSSRILY